MTDDREEKEIENLANIVPIPKKLYKVEDVEYMKTFLAYAGGKYTLLPELAEVMSFDSLIKFLSVFAGQTIDVPERKSLINTVRDMDIYFCLKANNSTSETARLAEKYSMTVPAIKWIFEKVQECLTSEASSS